MATVFEIKRDTETVYGIKTVSGACLWFTDRDSRDEKFLEMQNQLKKGLTTCQSYAIINTSKGKKEVHNYEMCERDFRN